MSDRTEIQSKHFPHAKGICQTLCSVFSEQQRPAETDKNHLSGRVRLLSLFFGSSLVSDDILPSVSAQWLLLCSPVFHASPHHSQWCSSQGLWTSNRDCACLRLSQSFEVGSYPSWAIQPSILALYRQPCGQECNEYTEQRVKPLAVHSLFIQACQDNCDCPPAHKNLYSGTVLLKVFWWQFDWSCRITSRSHISSFMSRIKVVGCSSWDWLTRMSAVKCWVKLHWNLKSDQSLVSSQERQHCRKCGVHKQAEKKKNETAWWLCVLLLTLGSEKHFNGSMRGK